MKQLTLSITITDAAAAFREWLRRYQEDPTAYDRDFNLESGSAADYGDACGRYFVKTLLEQRGVTQ